MSNELTAQQKFSEDLRSIAAFYDAHPEIKLPYESSHDWCIFGASKTEIAEGAKAFGSAEKIYDGDTFRLIKTFPHGITLEFYTNRKTVCEQVEVGSEVIPAHVIPAKFEPEVFIEERVIPKYEWRCSDSLLAEIPTAATKEVVDDIPF